jgi:hypothetical protein
MVAGARRLGCPISIVDVFETKKMEVALQS